MVEPIREPPISETGFGLNEEGKAQLRAFCVWVMLRLCPACSAASAAASVIFASPFFYGAAWVTLGLWVAGLVGSRQGRRESGASLSWLAREAGEAFAALRRWNAIAHARHVAARDDAPAHWLTPAIDDQHASYRETWARLAKRPRTDAEDATLVQILRGLRNYGDDPLVNPPTRTPARFAALMPEIGPLKFWPLYAVGALMLALGAQSLRVERLKDDVADRERVANEWAARAATSEANFVAEHTAREQAISRQLAEERESLTLAGERDALQSRLAQRTRSRNDEAQSRPDGAVVDYGERLRELAEPAASALVPAADAAGDPAG